MSQEKLPLDAVGIQNYLPYRYPFLLVDRIVEVEPHKHIVGFKNISVSEPALQGHFPGKPIFPGVMVIEGLAQTSGVLGFYSHRDQINDMLLTEISQARFRRMVIPGDTLFYEVELVKHRNHFFWFEGTARVEREVVAEVTFSALMR